MPGQPDSLRWMGFIHTRDSWRFMAANMYTNED